MRTHSFVLAATLIAIASPALAYTENAAVPTTVAADAPYEEEHYEEEVEFCGGGEESAFMLAWYEYEAQNYEVVRAMLVDGIKHGTIDAWDRTSALVLLGEVQVRMGDHRPAVHNFGRALEVDPSLEQSGARLGYAIALHGIGRGDEALELARAHVAACQGDASTVDCYGAFVLLSELTSDATEMFEAMRSAEAIVRGYPEIGDEGAWLLAAIESR